MSLDLEPKNKNIVSGKIIHLKEPVKYIKYM